jgi:tyrosyl-tRNA synthetase
MSKSLGNYVGIDEPPRDVFGKLMSISDDLMWRYIELLSLERPEVIARWKKDTLDGRNPRDIKVAFAQEIVTRFHDRKSAERALQDFEARHREGALPEDMPEVTVATGGRPIGIAQVLKQSGLTASTSEALRMIEQGGIRIDGERCSDKALALPAAGVVVLQVGKRKFARVTLA